MARKSGGQRERQKRLRDRNRAERRPGRDDIARVALYWMVSRMVAKGAHDVLDEMEDEIVARLVDQGFAEAASYEAFDALVEKYARSAWGFRRKTHLLFANDVEVAE